MASSTVTINLSIDVAEDEGSRAAAVMEVLSRACIGLALDGHETRLAVYRYVDDDD